MHATTVNESRPASSRATAGHRGQGLGVAAWRAVDEVTDAEVIGRALAAIPPTIIAPALLARAVAVALDWNSGRAYSPGEFVRDVSDWVERAGRDSDVWASETERLEYRRAAGS